MTLYLLLSPRFLAVAQSPDVAQSDPVVLRGRIACLSPSGQISSCHRDNDGSEPSYALETSIGKLYRFSSTDSLTKMFSDHRVRARELEITARLDSDDRLKIIRIHSVKAGKLYRIFYYCNICSITGFEPGPCYCCYQEFELKETPVSGP